VEGDKSLSFGHASLFRTCLARFRTCLALHRHSLVEPENDCRLSLVFSCLSPDISGDLTWSFKSRKKETASKKERDGFKSSKSRAFEALSFFLGPLYLRLVLHSTHHRLGPLYLRVDLRLVLHSTHHRLAFHTHHCLSLIQSHHSLAAVTRWAA